MPNSGENDNGEGRSCAFMALIQVNETPGDTLSTSTITGCRHGKMEFKTICLGFASMKAPIYMRIHYLPQCFSRGYLFYLHPSISILLS